MTKKWFAVLAIVIAVVHVGLVVFFGVKKAGFHEDEYYSYWSVSVAPNEMTPVNFTWKSGYDLQSRFFIRNDHRFDYETVVQNQIADVHPPLYYLALHTIMSFFPNSFYKWFGIILNLLFSLISYGCILALFYHMGDGVIPNREFAALLAGLIYAVAPSTISCIMLTRMYAMSTMWSIAYSLVFVLLMKSRNCSRRHFILLLTAGASICYCAFLTHYFALLIPFFLTAFYSLYTLFCRKGIWRMLIYGAVCALSVALGVISFPASLQHIFGGYRGTGVLHGLFGGEMPDRLSVFIGYMQAWIFSGTLYPCLILFTVMLLLLTGLVIRKNGWKNIHNFVCRMLAIPFSLFTSYIILCGGSLIVGEASCRYFYPVAALLFPYTAYTLWGAFSVFGNGIGQSDDSDGKRRFVFGIMAAGTLVLALIPAAFGYGRKNVLFLYEEDAEKLEFSREYSEYPLIMVFGSAFSYRSWYVDNQLWPFEQVFYLSYDQREALSDKKLQNAEKIVVYMDAPTDVLEQLIADNSHLTSYTRIRQDKYYYVYLLE